MIRQLRAGWRAGDVLLCGDWTLLRLFPPLRAAWALQGTQATVPITGANAKRVLFGTINLRTGLLREHRREDLITKIEPVMFDPDARLPL